MGMQGETKRSGWKIWLYLTPVYILVAVPLVKWTMRINSPDLKLSRAEYGAFNSSDGEVKKTDDEQYNPELDDSGYTVDYRSGKGGQGSQAPVSGSGQDRNAGQRTGAAARPQGGQNDRQAGRQYAQRAGNQAALESDDTRKKEQMGVGREKGYLTSAVGRMMGNPRAVGALMNNSWVVKGFMGRGTVQAALGSTQGLKNYLSDPQRVNNFLNNSVVQAALNNPAVVNAFATSDMAKAIMGSPAVQGLLADPSALNGIIANSPQAMQLMSNPNVMNALMNNPQTAGLAGSLGGMGGAKLPQQ